MTHFIPTVSTQVVPPPPFVESSAPLAAFLEVHRESLIASVNAAFPPIVTRAEVRSDLLRKPLGRQAEAITALAHVLQHNRWAMLIGEMGSGKSFTGVAAAYHCQAACQAGNKRILILVPPHLTKKTVREVETTVPNVRTRILRSVSDVEALRTLPADKPLFVVLSRERAKLSHCWRAAYTLKRQSVYYRNLQRWVHHKTPACPRCGNVLETDEGLITAAELEKKKYTCPSCTESLWQADNTGVRRYALAHYIADKLPGFF